jgi:hypothetical protein
MVFIRVSWVAKRNGDAISAALSDAVMFDCLLRGAFERYTIMFCSPEARAVRAAP